MIRLGLLFVTVTSLELFLLLKVGSAIGIVSTIGLIFFTGFLGAYLTRQQGLRVLREITETLQRGEMPTSEILSGVCLLVVGALLVTPGLLTDLTGFLLLVPAIRGQLIAVIERRMQRWIEQNAVQVMTAQHFDFEPSMGGMHQPGGPVIIDVEPKS